MKNVVRHVIVASLLSVCMRAADTTPLQHAVTRVVDQSALFLNRADITMKLGGRVRHEFFVFDSPLTLRTDFHDNYRFQRAKFNLDFDSSYGTRTYGRSAVDARFRITCFNVLDNLDVYTPNVPEDIAFDGKNFLHKAELGEHSHDGIVTNAYIEDGFVNVHLDALSNLPLPVSLKCGYFPFTLGRGVALGDYYGGSIDYLGFREKGDVGNTTQRSPGVLLSLGDEKTCAVQLYFSRWKERSQGPDFTKEVTRARRLDRIETQGSEFIERGAHADHNIYAARMLYSYDRTDSPAGYKLVCQPYALHVQAPELEVEFEGDASASVYTFGCMSEWSKGGWKLNIESAVQMGGITMHAIDRNRAVYGDAYYKQAATSFIADAEDRTTIPQTSAVSGRLDETYGEARKFHSHVLLGITDELDGSLAPDATKGEFIPYRAYYVEDELDHINANRSVAAQGARINRGPARKKGDKNDYANNGHVAGDIYQSRKAVMDPDETGMLNDTQYSPYTFESGVDYYDAYFGLLGIRPHGALYNANVPFGAGRRFRPRYELDCRGFMAMADLSYTNSSRSLTLACAAAHISGADYPHNKEQSQRYGGFIPFRDANYEGRIVKSYAVLAARKIARPENFSDNLMYAPNNFAATNLQYLGLGCVWRPYTDRNRLQIESNALYFWEDVPPYAWDTYKKRDFSNEKINGIWSKAQADLHFTGYQTAERASKRLGLELNTVLTWRPVKNLELRTLLATYLPGPLYRDIEGTPNAYTVRVDADGETHLESLGHHIPFGCMVRLTYYF